jgi:hypothetical protein
MIKNVVLFNTSYLIKIALCVEYKLKKALIAVIII